MKNKLFLVLYFFVFMFAACYCLISENIITKMKIVIKDEMPCIKPMFMSFLRRIGDQISDRSLNFSKNFKKNVLIKE
jgi:hypothetical protein